MYEDKTTKIDINTISQSTTFQTTRNSISEGFSRSAFWYKFDITNDTDHSAYHIIDFTERHIAKIDAYIVSKDGRSVHYRGGKSIPHEKKVIPSHTTRFPLSLDKAEQKSVYIRLSNQGPLLTTIRVMDEKELVSSDSLRDQLLGLYFGGILSLLLFNFFIYLSSRDRIYLHYMTYISAFMLLQLVTTGFLPFKIVPEVVFDLMITTSVALMLSFIILFSRDLLRSKQFTPLLDKVLYLLVWIIMLLMIVSLFGTHVTKLILNIISFILIPILLYAAIISHRKGNKVAKFYINAQVVFFITSMVYFLMVAGVLPYNDFTRYSILVGSLYEMILFSLALAYRIKTLEDEKRALEIRSKERLEVKVQARTRELKNVQKKIKELNIHLQQRVDEEVKKNERQQLMMLQQSRMAQMGEMLSMIAHQWRQPLASINSAVSTLKLKNSLDQHETEYFDTKFGNVLDYTQHLSKTINDFKDFFKEHKKSVTTTLEQTIESTLMIVQPTIEEKKIALVYDFTCEKSIRIYENEFKQVILNLIKNAEDVLIERSVAEPEIKIKTYSDDTMAVMEIRDNAGGIPEHDLEKVFDPYFTTKLQDGTGLGLYMSKTIIEEHCNGTLRVRNEDEGAVFTIKVPLESLNSIE